MFTAPEKILCTAVIVAGVVQLAKFFLPLLNGWGAIASNAVVSAVALFVVFRFELTWTMLAMYILIGLAAAGIHGTTTKISDYPNPHENPTPSGTPAQNFGRLTDN
jgi:uncharacterized membrane protein HdeD (DUF308 family)